jgi:hypothetical protein
MKRLLAAAAAAAAIAVGSATPAAATPLPVQGEPILCRVNIAYTTTPGGGGATGSGTCTGLQQLHGYTATVASSFGRGSGGCPPASLPLFLTMSLPDGSGRTLAFEWRPNTLGLMNVGAPLQAGLLLGTGILGLGLGGGAVNCVPGANFGTVQSNATLLFTYP